MKRIVKLTSLSGLLFILLLFQNISSGNAQSNVNYKIQFDVLSQGGRSSSSKKYLLQDVLGQSSPGGKQSSAEYSLQAGYVKMSQQVESLQPHFTFRSNTGDSYSIIVNSATIDGQPLETSDEIGVFTPAALCVGASVWNGTTPLGLTAWIDDSQTQQVVDGYKPGENMSFKIWDSSAAVELSAAATFTDGDGTFGSGPYASVDLAAVSTGAASITVLAPNGGDTLVAGSQYEIKWSSTNLPNFVRIDYSVDENASHITVVDSTENDGSYLWTIPGTPSTNCVIIVSDATDGQPFDISDAVFSIVEPASGNNIVVINTNDAGPGSLREAIELANANPGPDTIRFAIPKTDAGYTSSTGVWTIMPTSALPVITDIGFMVDGRTQAEFIGEDTNLFGPEIEISGINAGTNTVGLFFSETFDVALFDLIINNFSGVGIWMWNVENGWISGCYIGVNSTGMEGAGNYDGINLSQLTENISVGEADSFMTPNIISSNKRMGIFIADSSSYNDIDGNIIGLNRELDGILGNADSGISIQRDCDSNLVIYNYIGGNKEGISIYQSKANTISNNFIGTDELFDLNLGNKNIGISLFGNAQFNKIEENIIGFNRASGVYIFGQGAIGNRISRNSISQNNDLGIATVSGGNAMLPPPVILSATPSVVSGTAGPGQIIEIFTDDDDEGKIFIGSTAADAFGNFTLALINPGILLAHFTATATDAQGNTSQFSKIVIPSVKGTAHSTPPDHFKLSQNFPNPFNPATVISYGLPESAQVTLRVINLLGEEVITLINREQVPGYYSVTWNGVDQNGRQVANGVYLYRFSAGDFKAIKKMIFMK